MKRFLSIAMALVHRPDDEPRRQRQALRWRQELGSAPIHQTSQATPTTPAAAPTAWAVRRPPAGGASRWLGPLAGIAAGGLLASMFMGDGFQGMQIMDFLIMALIAFLVFRFIAASSPAAGRNMAAGHAPMQREASRKPAMQSIFGGSAAPAAAAPVINAPAWFNEASFLGRPQPLPVAAAALGRQRNGQDRRVRHPANARVPQA
jgi:predicted lipid-binding transport protein (Tim44 family)